MGDKRPLTPLEHLIYWVLGFLTAAAILWLAEQCALPVDWRSPLLGTKI